MKGEGRHCKICRVLSAVDSDRPASWHGAAGCSDSAVGSAATAAYHCREIPWSFQTGHPVLSLFPYSCPWAGLRLWAGMHDGGGGDKLGCCLCTSIFVGSRPEEAGGGVQRVVANELLPALASLPASGC